MRTKIQAARLVVSQEQRYYYYLDNCYYKK